MVSQLRRSLFKFGAVGGECVHDVLRVCMDAGHAQSGFSGVGNFFCDTVEECWSADVSFAVLER